MSYNIVDITQLGVVGSYVTVEDGTSNKEGNLVDTNTTEVPLLKHTSHAFKNGVKGSKVLNNQFENAAMNMQWIEHNKTQTNFTKSKVQYLESSTCLQEEYLKLQRKDLDVRKRKLETLSQYLQQSSLVRQQRRTARLHRCNYLKRVVKSEQQKVKAMQDLLDALS